jgi:hypothetical protein
MVTKMEEFQAPSSTRLGLSSPVLFANGLHNIQTFIYSFGNLVLLRFPPKNADFKHQTLSRFE